MPTRTEKGDDGKTYLVYPDGKRVELAESEPPSTSSTLLGKAADVVTNPEVLGGASSFLPGVTGKIAPPIVGGLASAGRDLYHGERDPATIGSHALGHAALNALPLGVGAAAGAARYGALEMPSITEALAAGGSGRNMIGSLMKFASKMSPVNPNAFVGPPGTMGLGGAGAALATRGAEAAASASPSVLELLKAIMELRDPVAADVRDRNLPGSLK